MEQAQDSGARNHCQAFEDWMIQETRACLPGDLALVEDAISYKSGQGGGKRKIQDG